MRPAPLASRTEAPGALSWRPRTVAVPYEVLRLSRRLDGDPQPQHSGRGGMSLFGAADDDLSAQIEEAAGGLAWHGPPVRKWIVTLHTPEHAEWWAAECRRLAATRSGRAEYGARVLLARLGVTA